MTSITAAQQKRIISLTTKIQKLGFEFRGRRWEFGAHICFEASESLVRLIQFFPENQKNPPPAPGPSEELKDQK